MNKKELKGLSKKIAFQEFRHSKATTLEERQDAENNILKLSSRIKSMRDIVLLDSMILEELDKLMEEQNF